MCVCVLVCECGAEREREEEVEGDVNITTPQTTIKQSKTLKRSSFNLAEIVVLFAGIITLFPVS